MEKLFDKSLNKFLTYIISFATLHTSLICLVLIPFLKDHKMTAIEISMLLTIRKVVKIVADIPFGMIFDKFGAKAVFVVGRILKISSFFVFLLKPSFSVFAVAIFLDGFSYSAIYGKISAYIYNHLSRIDKTKIYARCIAIYYFSVDVVHSVFSLATAILLKAYNYDILIYCSIAIGMTSLLIAFFLPKDKEKIANNYNKKSSGFKDILKTLRDIMKGNKTLLYLLMFHGIGNFIAWQFGSVGSMVLLDMKYSASDTAFVGSAAKVFMGLGCLLPFFVFKNGIKIRSAVKLFVIFIILGIASAFVYQAWFFVAFMLSTIFFYTLIEVSIEQKFESLSDPKIRGTVTAIGWFFCSIITAFSIILVGFFAEIHSYKMGLIALLSLLIILLAYIMPKLYKIKD